MISTFYSARGAKMDNLFDRMVNDFVPMTEEEMTDEEVEDEKQDPEIKMEKVTKSMTDWAEKFVPKYIKKESFICRESVVFFNQVWIEKCLKETLKGSLICFCNEATPTIYWKPEELYRPSRWRNGNQAAIKLIK